MSYESEAMNNEEKEALYILMERRLEGILSQLEEKPRKRRKVIFQPANREITYPQSFRVFEA